MSQPIVPGPGHSIGGPILTLHLLHPNDKRTCHFYMYPRLYKSQLMWTLAFQNAHWFRCVINVASFPGLPRFAGILAAAMGLVLLSKVSRLTAIPCVFSTMAADDAYKTI